MLCCLVILQLSSLSQASCIGARSGITSEGVTKQHMVPAPMSHDMRDQYDMCFGAVQGRDAASAPRRGPQLARAHGVLEGYLSSEHCSIGVPALGLELVSAIGSVAFKTYTCHDSSDVGWWNRRLPSLGALRMLCFFL